MNAACGESILRPSDAVFAAVRAASRQIFSGSENSLQDQDGSRNVIANDLTDLYLKTTGATGAALLITAGR